MEIIINTPGLYIHFQDAVLLVQLVIDGFLQITSNIKYTVEKWDPRISVTSLKATPNFDDNGFDVHMNYVIRGLDNPPVAVEFFLARTR